MYDEQPLVENFFDSRLSGWELHAFEWAHGSGIAGGSMASGQAKLIDITAVKNSLQQQVHSPLARAARSEEGVRRGGVRVRFVSARARAPACLIAGTPVSDALPARVSCLHAVNLP